MDDPNNLRITRFAPAREQAPATHSVAVVPSGRGGRFAYIATSCMLISLCGLDGTSLAQTSGPASVDAGAKIEEVIVVETRLRDDVFGIPENVSVDAESLAKIEPSDPEQLFQRLPGFSVSRVGGPGGVSEIFLRGAESNFTTVYIDGIRLNDSSNTRGGSFDFSLLSAFDMGSVDVASGAMSAVHGADAMAGVIRIRSAWAVPGSARLLLEHGSQNDWRAGAEASFQPRDDVEWNIRASSADGGDEIDGSALRLDSIGTRLAGSLPRDGAWELTLRYAERERTSFPEVSGGPEFAVNRELETGEGDQAAFSVAGDWNLSPSWRSGLYMNGSRTRDTTMVPAVAPGVLDGQPAFTTITEFERAQLLWVNRIELAPDTQLVTGLDLVHESGSDDGAVDLGFAVLPNAYSLDRSLASAFAELGRQWSANVTTTVALRLDDYDGGQRVSGKLGIARIASPAGSRIWAQAGNGFKLPSFFALGNPLYGNPDLVEEKARTAELGYTLVFGDGNEAVLSVFDSRYDDLVDFDFETFTNVNLGRIDVTGLQLRLGLALADGLRLYADATWSDIDSRSGPLRRRPEEYGGIGVDWTFAEAWNLDVSARYAGSRLVTSIPTGDVTDGGYTIVSTTARYRLKSGASFWIAADNAFDQDYQQAPGFPAPGARLRAGAQFIF